MKKRLITLFLALTVCLALAIPALAGEITGSTIGEEVELLSSCNHTPGVYIRSEWRESNKFDPFVHCYYDVQWDYVRCAKCSTPYSYETTEETYALHRKQFVYNEYGVAKGFTCTECNYCSWKSVPKPPVVTE